mmetsp:Transcript_23404/g.66548  ORF Transcript_23404/g.66548 Transcript_23404/m.66548 type:complete len:264 (+) Transcript_23404:183-974(+)
MSADKKKEEGNAAFQAGDMNKAVALYTEAIAIDDLNHVFYANRAAAYLALKKFEEARADSKKCIALDASFTKAYLRLATAEKELGNKEAALKIVREGMSHFKEGTGKKAKKSGLGDFKRLEKELKGELKPPPSARQSVEQAVRSGNAQAGAQELGQKVISAQYKLHDLQGRRQQRMRDHQGKQIVLRSLEQALAGKENAEVNTFRRMGKAYLMQDCSQVMSDLQSEMTSLENEVKSLTKGEAHLKRQVEDADRTLQDFVRRQQ